MHMIFYGFRHGHIFDFYRLAEQTPEVHILAAIEDDPQAKAVAENKLGISVESGTYAAWLDNPAVDIVAIGSAYGHRGKAVIEALLHGKHVISDKPLCIALEELAQIRQLAQSRHLQIGCLLDLRYTAAALRAKALFDSGKLGAVKNISFTGQHCIDYAHRPEWYFAPNMHGGTINDIAIHGIDLITFLTGHHIRKIHCARTWNCFAYRHPHFHDCATFMAETDQEAGVLADVSYSAPSQVFSMPTYWNFQFWCEKGLLTFSYTGQDVTVYEEGTPEAQIFPGISPKSNVLKDFLQQIHTGDDEQTQLVLDATQSALIVQHAANQ